MPFLITTTTPDPHSAGSKAPFHIVGVFNTKDDAKNRVAILATQGDHLAYDNLKIIQITATDEIYTFHQKELSKIRRDTLDAQAKLSDNPDVNSDILRRIHEQHPNHPVNDSIVKHHRFHD